MTEEYMIDLRLNKSVQSITNILFMIYFPQKQCSIPRNTHSHVHFMNGI